MFLLSRGRLLCRTSSALAEQTTSASPEQGSGVVLTLGPEHALGGGDEFGGALDVALGLLGGGRLGFVVGALAGFLRLLGERMEVLVEGSRSDKALVEEPPGVTWRRAYSSYSERAA